MTHTEAVLAEINESIRRALADWEACFAPVTRDSLNAIVAGERMAGVLTRVQILSDMVIEQAKREKSNEQGRAS